MALPFNLGPGMLNGQQQQPLPRMPWNQNQAVTGFALGMLGSPNINAGFQNAAPMALAGMAGNNTNRQLMMAQQEKAATKAEQDAKRARMNEIIKAWPGLTPELRALYTEQPELFGQAIAPPQPTDDMREFKAAQADPAFADFLKNKAATTEINMPPDETAEAALAKSLGSEVAKDLVVRRTTTNDAVLSLKSSQEARKLLDSGMMTGFGADWAVGFGKALQQVGFTAADDAIANTEAFIATRAQEVGRIIKLFGAGTGLSDADRDYATKAAAGQITLNEASIRRILDINDKAARNVIENFNKDAAPIDAQKLVPFPLSIELPPETAAPTVPTPASVDLNSLSDADLDAELRRRGVAQ
jgi:hypothetical protein